MKGLKKVIWIVVFGFICLNIISFNHAYRFTHFSQAKDRTNKPEELGKIQKLKTLFLGVKNPKPQLNEFPRKEYHTFSLKSHEELEAWDIKIQNSKGIVILFHGYSSSKSGLLSYSTELNNLGYSTVLVDFMGCGGSTGNKTTIGYKEAQDVKVVFDYVRKENPKEEIILLGSSMGAVAIMKSINEFKIRPDKLILECPFGTMLGTTKRRFKAMGVPTFPFAEMLLFYGGLQTGFNPFKHKPIEYAKGIDVPTLLLHGSKDERVTKEEINSIYQNLAGVKQLYFFEKSGHEIYLQNSKPEWIKVIQDFL